MIIYHPATDFYHCWMRWAYIVAHAFDDPVEYERARIIDYYICFPKQLLNCQLPSLYSGQVKKAVRLIPESYEDALSVRQAFRQMSEIHRHVAMDMASKGLIDRSLYQEGQLSVVDSEYSRGLLSEVAAKWDPQNKELYDLILVALNSMQLNSKNGLKDRSGLLEYRYDG
jgi:hypothetical protein